MPTERTFSIFLAIFAYGGNGGTAMISPQLAEWLVESVLKLKADPRISNISHQIYSDTPIPMTRAASILDARKAGADFVLWLDNDNLPGCELRDDPTAKPFLETSLEFLIGHYDKGPAIVAAPYRGPGPDSCTYVFRVDNSGYEGWKLGMYDNVHAEMMTGIQPAGAVATGVVLFDNRVHDYFGPKWLDYEWEGEGKACEHCGERVAGHRAAKASTEDVFWSRSALFGVQQKLGYHCVFCNWDAWAAHLKPQWVRKPRSPKIDHIESQYVRAIQQGTRSDRRLAYIGEQSAGPGPEDVVYGYDGKPLQNSPVAHRNTEPVSSTLTPKQLGEKWLAENLPISIAAVVDDDGLIQIGMTTPKKDREALAELVRMVKERAFETSISVVEVGSWVGATACAIASELGEDDYLACVDTWLGTPSDSTSLLAKEVRSEVLEKCFDFNTAKYKRQISKIKSNSNGASTKFLSPYSRKPDLIFLDADHTKQGLLSDLNSWVPTLREDGIVCGHDYSSQFPGVAQAVIEYFGHERIHLCPGSCIWWVDMAEQPVESPAPAPKTEKTHEYSVQIHDACKSILRRERKPLLVAVLNAGDGLITRAVIKAITGSDSTIVSVDEWLVGYQEFLNNTLDTHGCALPSKKETPAEAADDWAYDSKIDLLIIDQTDRIGTAAEFARWHKHLSQRAVVCFINADKKAIRKISESTGRQITTKEGFSLLDMGDTPVLPEVKEEAASV